MEKQELADRGISAHQRLRRAIEEGDTQKALAPLDQIIEGNKGYANSLLVWIDLLFTRLAENRGDEAVNDAKEFFYNRYARPGYGADLMELSTEDRLRSRAHGWTDRHLLPENIEMEEDDEKFTVKVHCNSGGFLREQRQYGKTSNGYPWSRGEVSCFFCTITGTGEILMTKEYGYPPWFLEPSGKPDGLCTTYIYKNPKDIPEEFYRKRGLWKTP